jgi:hypothetical protein
MQNRHQHRKKKMQTVFGNHRYMLVFHYRFTAVFQRDVKILNKSQTLFSANFRPLGLHHAKRQFKLSYIFMILSPQSNVLEGFCNISV